LVLAVALALAACGKEKQPAVQTADVDPVPGSAATLASATEPPTSAPSAQGTAAPNDADPQTLDPDNPYTNELWGRIQELVGQDCSSGVTESVDLEIKDGKITFFEDTDDKPNPKMVGKTVPKPPKELEPFFAKRIFVGICVYYVKQRE
jgi:hypothetical protein